MPQVSKTTTETLVPEGTRDITGTESGGPEKTLRAAAARKMTLPPQPQFSERRRRMEA